jgi:hypothetical protein
LLLHHRHPPQRQIPGAQMQNQALVNNLMPLQTPGGASRGLRKLLP